MTWILFLICVVGILFFYQYHPPFVTKESVLKDMKALPSGKNYDDKFYVGFLKRNL